MTMNYSEILTAAYLEGEFGGEHNRLRALKGMRFEPHIHMS